ncbi:hypothetical protein BT96DRAFT_942214 [Gymnopus androsaceus JB14]|uniref:Uncharacterized protein n=1 Tax=Gymnopus androsaceus JB14 TaxID=1447944 RepID=A0A6A4HD44_9AGAR|nr:hypothetical protein BT96DRAFT_942214 [Gymnopus androsaceus JB14]
MKWTEEIRDEQWSGRGGWLIHQAEEDDILDFEHSSDEDYEERLRQKAESVPLCPKDYVDPLDEVIMHWMASETENLLQRHPTSAPPSQNTESRNSPAPTSPSVPQVIVDFLVDKLVPPVTSAAARAWNVLHEYLTHNKPPSRDAVKMSLDELEVGEEWHAMRIRIMQVKPGDDEAAQTLLADLEQMKPAEQVVAEQEVDMEVNASLEPLLTDNEYDPTSEELEEQDGLTALVAHAAMLEDCEVFYVRCQQGTESDIVQRIQRDSRNGKAPPGLRGAFPSMLPGGLYIRITSILQMHTQASSYFRTIYGFKYPHKPIVLHPSDTIVLPPSKNVHLLMPIHRRVVDASQLIEQRRLRNIPQPRTWILAKKGRYRGDIGVVLDTEYTNERPRKKAKVSHLQSEEVSSQHASTIVSTLPVNGKRRAAQPRRAKIQCYQCERPRMCNHLSKVYTMSGQTVTDSGIALVVLNHVNCAGGHYYSRQGSYRWPLPSSWFFDHGERVQLALHYGPFTRDAEIDNEITSSSEGWIESCKWAQELKFDKTQVLLMKGWWLRLAMLFLSSSTGSDDLTHSFHANCLKNLSLMPKVHLAHEPYFPRNEMHDMALVYLSILMLLPHLPILYFNFDRIRRCDNGCFLTYELDASLYFQFRPGYTPTHSLGETYHDYGWSKGIMQLEHKQLSAAQKRLDDEERQKAAAHERQAIVSHGNRVQDTAFTQGGAPLTLRAATPTPLMNWIDDPEITKALPRGKVMVALRDISDDVEIVISAEEDCSNKAVYWVKPKGKAPVGTIITAQHLDPFRCGHTADNSYSPKLYLICSGQHAGRLGRAIMYGIDDDIVLKPVQHERQMTGNKFKVRCFVEKPVDGPLLHVSKFFCAFVPMMLDEEKAAKTATPISKLQDIVKKQLYRMTLMDEEKVLVGEIDYICINI